MRGLYKYSSLSTKKSKNKSLTKTKKQSKNKKETLHYHYTSLSLRFTEIVAVPPESVEALRVDRQRVTGRGGRGIEERR